MPKDIVIGLNSLTLKATMPEVVSTPIGADKKRVFTEDEWNFLNTRPTEELWLRIQHGNRLIGLLSRPDMLNMTSGKAAMISSNLRFQQDAIREIIKQREVNDGSR